MKGLLPVDLLDDFSFADARGGRKGAALDCQIVRELTEADLPALQDRNLTPAASQSVLGQLRSAHHQLAQLLARGLDQETVCLMTGYSTAYISRLRGDPAFSKLLEYYCIEREQVQIDVLERMKALGLATLEELQQRLTEEPESFSIRELHEQAKLLLPTEAAARQAAPGSSGSGALTVNVSFISPPEPSARPELELQVNKS